MLVAVAEGRQRSQLALAQTLRIDRTAMTYLLDAMEEQELVTRTPGADDRRVRVVAITQEGERAMKRAQERLRATEERLLSVLDPAEAQTFRTLMTRIAKGTQDLDV